MSHLLKKNKNVLFSIRLFFILLFLIITLRTTTIYTGNKLIYLLFSVISFYLINFSFRKKSFFYENFFGTFILLGFWIKFSFILILKTNFTEGNTGYFIAPENFDAAIAASCVGILAFIIFGHIREFFFNYPQKLKIDINVKYYKKYRTIILVSFFCLILIICFSNYFFQIYQRGFVGQNYHFLINGFVKTCLLYFLTLCSAIILYYDIASYKKVFVVIIFLIFLEAFLSSLSMLSRGMIFNSSALLYALYKLSNKIDLKLNFVFFLKMFVILIITFVISVIYVNQLRINVYWNLEKPYHQNKKLNIISNADLNNNRELKKFSDKNFDRYDYSRLEDLDPNTKSKNLLSKSFYRFNHLMLKRWVGIDSMLVVTRNKEILSLDLFKQSLKEKFNAKLPSFYESTFNILPPDFYKIESNRKGNTLPGLITFLFFSGSYIFLFSMMMLFCLLASILEYLFFRLTFNNLLASGLIGMVISYRFANFGYLPAQSYLLFGSIIGVMFTFFVIRFFHKFYFS